MDIVSNAGFSPIPGHDLAYFCATYLTIITIIIMSSEMHVRCPLLDIGLPIAVRYSSFYCMTFRSVSTTS